jgi:hypothetical protein
MITETVRKAPIEPGESDAQGTERKSYDDRQESAKYRKKIDELNRSRDIDIDRALMLRAALSR